MARINWDRYLEILKRYPDLTNESGVSVIELLNDDNDIDLLLRQNIEDCREHGRPDSWADIGAVFESPYHLILQDPVRFPGGRLGTYLRVIPKPMEGPTVVVLPVLKGNVVLISHFRHGCRSHQWEIPRGSPTPGVSDEDVARNEIAEEIGGSVNSLTFLGRSRSDTGFSRQQAVLYLAELTELGNVATEEGIAELRQLSVAELESMLLNDRIVDSYTIAAFTKARLRDLI